MRALPALAVGAMLSALAAPALLDAMRALPAGAVIDAMRAGSHVSEATRLGAAEALKGVSEARLLADRAALLPPGTAAEATAVAALKQRPLDAHTWLRLAYLRQARGAPKAEVAAAVVASMMAAPTNRPLLFARLPLAAEAWEGISRPADRTRVLDQVALAWDVDPARTRTMLRSLDGAALLRRMFSRTQAPAVQPIAAPLQGSAG